VPAEHGDELEVGIQPVIGGGEPAAGVADDDRRAIDGRAVEEAGGPDFRLRLGLAPLVVVAESPPAGGLVLADQPFPEAAYVGGRDVVEFPDAGPAAEVED